MANDVARTTTNTRVDLEDLEALKEAANQFGSTNVTVLGAWRRCWEAQPLKRQLQFLSSVKREHAETVPA